MTMAAPPYSAESEAIMANEKMTMKTFLNGVLATEGIAPELAEFATAEIEKIKEKNEKRRNSLTPAQVENENLKAKFVETATAETAYAASAVAEMLGVSTQKASALMRALKAEGVVAEGEGKSATGKGKVKTYTLTGVEFVPKKAPEKEEA